MPYGQRLAERLQAANASVIVTRVLRKAVIAATEIRSDHWRRGLEQQGAGSRAAAGNFQYWEDDRRGQVCTTSGPA
jgi:hypothetical protein